MGVPNGGPEAGMVSSALEARFRKLDRGIDASARFQWACGYCDYRWEAANEEEVHASKDM